MSRPMTADQWQRQMKKWDVNCQYRKGWEHRGRPASTGPFSNVNGIVVHHTGSDSQSSDYVDFLFERGRADLPAPLCHAATSMSGRTYIGATGRCNHAGKGSSKIFNKVLNETISLTKEEKPGPSDMDGNARMYGNEVMYDGGQPMTKEQYEGLVRWCAAVCDFHDWDGRSIIGHGEWTSAKWDPGLTDMAQLRRDVNALLKAGPAGPVPEPGTKPKTLYTARAYSLNTNGVKALTFPKRVPLMAAEIETAKPTILLGQETYAALRPMLSRKIKQLSEVSIIKGKVIWIDRDVWKPIGKPSGFALGNGKHAASIELEHLKTHARLGVSSGHLSHKAGDFNKRKNETTSWIRQMQHEYPGIEHLLGGDWNVDRHGYDYAGVEAARLGYTDCELDVEKMIHGEYDTFNGYRKVAPKNGIHIDRFARTSGLLCTRVRVDTHPAPQASDHFGFEVAIGHRAK